MKQPEGSKLCGHVCLAMIMRIELIDAIQLIGHTKGTKSKELRQWFTGNPIQKGQPTAYSLCKCRPKGMKCKGNWHWVLYLNNEVFDPTVGKWISFDQWSHETGLKISSYIEIVPPL